MRFGCSYMLKQVSCTNRTLLSTIVTVVYLCAQKKYWLQPFAMPGVSRNVHFETWIQQASVVLCMNYWNAAEILQIHLKSPWFKLGLTLKLASDLLKEERKRIQLFLLLRAELVLTDQFLNWPLLCSWLTTNLIKSYLYCSKISQTKTHLVCINWCLINFMNSDITEQKIYGSPWQLVYLFFLQSRQNKTCSLKQAA